MTAMRTLAATALAALALAGCSHKQKKLAAAPVPVDPPRVQLGVPSVQKVGFSGADLLFPATVENPNLTPLAIVRVEYTLDLEGKRAAQGAQPLQLAVPPAAAAVPEVPATPVTPAIPGQPAVPGTAALTLPVQLKFGAVPGVAKVFALDREAQYALGGAVVFLTPSGEVRVPIAATGSFAAPHAPAFQVGRLQLKHVGPTEIALELEMQVRNTNAFELPAGRVGAGLHLSGKEVVRADMVFAEPIAAGATAATVVPIKISPLKAGKAAARLLIPFSSIDASLKGEAVFGDVPVPLELSTAILPGK
jgi:hypothetical protein